MKKFIEIKRPNGKQVIFLIESIFCFYTDDNNQTIILFKDQSAPIAVSDTYQQIKESLKENLIEIGKQAK